VYSLSGPRPPSKRHRPARIYRTASQNFTAATRANQRSDNYVLMTVGFAIVLFVATFPIQT
jgi:hypothetical protein